LKRDMIKEMMSLFWNTTWFISLVVCDDYITIMFEVIGNKSIYKQEKHIELLKSK